MGAPVVHVVDDEEQRCCQFFLTDALGTVRDVVDDSGDVIQSYEFNEHGIPMVGSGASSGTFSPKTYQGGLSVNDDRSDSGLYLMGHRHYAADLGRFISRDPIGFAGGLNLFNGASTNPMTMVDPEGLEPVFTPEEEAKIHIMIRPDHAELILQNAEYIHNLPPVDMGANWTECFRNCVNSMDPLSTGHKAALAAGGAPIPKSALKPLGIKFSRGFGPASRFTSIPSVIAHYVPKGGLKTMVRGTGRAASRLLGAYTAYMGGVATLCAAVCAERHCE
jgi:RHS repeat-associated protein